jgi:hypothetical protein
MRLLFTVAIGALVLAAGSNWRRLVAVVVAATLIWVFVLPSPAYGQIGLVGAIQAVLNVINGVIASALSAVQAAMATVRSFYEQVVWPVNLINQAKALVSQMIAQFRGLMQSIHTASVASASLPNPTALESIIRNHQTGDFAALEQAYRNTFRPVPAAPDADPLDRGMIDIDDAMAMSTLKTLKMSDRAGDSILQAANQIESAASRAAPGSAPFLTAASTVANIQSQALMQKMIAAQLRQEAARLTHDNAIRKRNAMIASQLRTDINNLLKR